MEVSLHAAVSLLSSRGEVAGHPWSKINYRVALWAQCLRCHVVTNIVGPSKKDVNCDRLRLRGQRIGLFWVAVPEGNSSCRNGDKGQKWGF